MKRSSASLSLGEALYLYSKERGKEEQAYAFLQSLTQALEEEPLLLSYLNSPAVDLQKKKEKLDRLLSASPSSFKTWAVLSFKKGRSAFRPDEALEGFRKPYDLEHGYKRGLVYSARPLSDKEKADLQAALGGEKVALSYKIDPALIGGYRIYIDGRLIERSLEGKLDEARKKLLAEED